MSPELERALILIQQKRFAEAEPVIRQALASDSNQALALSYLALAELGQNRLKEAEIASGQAIAEDPERAYSYFVRAVILRVKGDLPNAENTMRIALAKSPSDAGYHAELAEILLARDKPDEAMDFVSRGLALDPESKELLKARTEVLLARRDLAAARQSAAETLRRDPEDGASHAQVGLIALRENDIATAQKHLLEALRLDPEHDGAKSGLVTVMKARNSLYRGMLAFSNWMRTLGPKLRWGVIIGIFLLFRIMRGAARQDDGLAPWLVPLMIAYVLFIYLSWTIDPLTTLVLRLDAVGRVALSRDEIRASNLVGGAIVCAILLFILGVAMQASWPFLGSLVFALIVIPIAGTFNAEGKGRRVLGSIAVLVTIAGVIGLILMASGSTGPGLMSVGLCLLGIFAFGWIAQFFMWK